MPNWFCWHKWGKWQQYKEGGTISTFYMGRKLEGSTRPYEDHRQRRFCEKCGKMQDKLIRSIGG